MRKLVALSLVVLSCWGGVSYALTPVEWCTQRNLCYTNVNRMCDEFKTPENDFNVDPACRAAINERGSERDKLALRMGDSCRASCEADPAFREPAFRRGKST